MKSPKGIEKHLDFPEDREKSDRRNFIYKYSQITQRSNFQQDKNDASMRGEIFDLHLGQLKLFFSELLFLTKHGREASLVLYVGAANGYHTGKLADLFPKLRFDLWDASPFDLILRDNIRIYNFYFDNAWAQFYSQKDEKILFICDIRNLAVQEYISKKSEKGTESLEKAKREEKIVSDIVQQDMVYQKRWVQIIQPHYVYLKFRLPSDAKKSVYFGGTHYLQPYSFQETESRLMTNQYLDVDYEDDVYDEKMAYFNFKIRPDRKIPELYRWRKIFKIYNLKSNWDNCAALYITDYYLRRYRHIESDYETGKLYMEIVQYHIDKYGTTYRKLFN